MESAYRRAYSFFYMGVTTLCVVAGIGALMALCYPLSADVSFDVANVTAFGHTNRGFEEAFLSFDIDADLSALVHVNTRLFYSYIIAEWGTADDDRHSAILWNHLIKREQPKFHAQNLQGNFTLRQVGKSIAGKTVNLTFRIQQVPFVGFMRTKNLLSKEFTMPKKYVLSK